MKDQSDDPSHHERTLLPKYFQGMNRNTNDGLTFVVLGTLEETRHIFPIRAVSDIDLPVWANCSSRVGGGRGLLKWFDPTS